MEADFCQPFPKYWKIEKLSGIIEGNNKIKRVHCCYEQSIHPPVTVSRHDERLPSLYHNDLASVDVVDSLFLKVSRHCARNFVYLQQLPSSWSPASRRYNAYCYCPCTASLIASRNRTYMQGIYTPYYRTGG